MHTPITFNLMLGDELVATIRTTALDFPMTHGEIVSSYSFDRYRTFFDRPDGWLDSPEGGALYDEIEERGFFVLVNTETDEHLGHLFMNCSGNQISFRGSGAA